MSLLLPSQSHHTTNPSSHLHSSWQQPLIIIFTHSPFPITSLFLPPTIYSSTILPLLPTPFTHPTNACITRNEGVRGMHWDDFILLLTTITLHPISLQSTHPHPTPINTFLCNGSKSRSGCEMYPTNTHSLLPYTLLPSSLHIYYHHNKYKHNRWHDIPSLSIPSKQICEDEKDMMDDGWHSSDDTCKNGYEGRGEEDGIVDDCTFIASSYILPLEYLNGRMMMGLKGWMRWRRKEMVECLLLMTIEDGWGCEVVDEDG